MKFNLRVLSILVLLSPSISFGRCFVHIFMGHADSNRHFHRSSFVEERAKALGCKVFKTRNLKMKATYESLDKFMKTEGFDPKKDKLHISYVDHGSSKKLPFGGDFQMYDVALEELDKALPDGTNVTFDSHICWPRFHETISNAKFKNIASMCGGSSVDFNFMANGIMSERESDRLIEYQGAGWQSWKDKHSSPWYEQLGDFFFPVEDEKPKINMFDFHYSAITKDPTDASRGSSLTSTAFARNELEKEEGSTSVFQYPMIDFHTLPYGQIEPLKKESWMAEASVEDIKAFKNSPICPAPSLLSGFRESFKLYESIYQIGKFKTVEKLKKLVTDHPELKFFEKMYLNSEKWLRENWSHIEKEGQKLYLEKEKLNKVYDISGLEDEKYAELEEKWKALDKKMKELSKNVVPHMRIMNDVHVISMLNDKMPEKMNKYKEFLKCERANALDME